MLDSSNFIRLSQCLTNFVLYGNIYSEIFMKINMHRQSYCITILFIKQPFGLKTTVLSLQYLIKSTAWAMTAVRSSLVPHAVLLIPLRAKKCILMVQQHHQKAVCKSRLAWSSLVKYLVFLGSA